MMGLGVVAVPAANARVNALEFCTTRHRRRYNSSSTMADEVSEAGFETRWTGSAMAGARARVVPAFQRLVTGKHAEMLQSL